METGRKLVAACGVDPDRLGELLAACEVYQPGLTTEIMSDLMTFDKELALSGPEALHEAIRLCREHRRPFPEAFEAFDEITRQEAFATDTCRLLAIDLVAREILHSGGLEVTHSGEIHLGESADAPPRSVTYVLPKHWRIRSLDQSPPKPN